MPAHFVKMFDIPLAVAWAGVLAVLCLFVNGLASQVCQPCFNVALGNHKTDLFTFPSEWNAGIGAGFPERLYAVFDGLRISIHAHNQTQPSTGMRAPAAAAIREFPRKLLAHELFPGAATRPRFFRT